MTESIRQRAVNQTSAPFVDAPKSENSVADSVRWTLEMMANRSLSTVNWLAHDIDNRYSTALSLLSDPAAPLETLRLAKDVYKTMRQLGETREDRHLAGRFYLSAIAAAYVHHGQRISTQSDRAFHDALNEMSDDETVPTPLRSLACAALNRLNASP